MAHRIALAFTLVALILVASRTGAQTGERDTERANVEVSGHGGHRTEADVTPALLRIRAALRRCQEQGRAASGAAVRVSLDVAASGRVTVAPIGDSASPPFQTCVVGALAHVRLAAGETGTVELTITWHEPRSYGTATLGGFHGRRSSLPEHPRAEQERPPYPADQISSVAQQHDAEVRHCFSSELAHRPDVSGTLEVSFTIGVDGTVSNASVAHDEIHVPAVSECLLARLASWTFPAPSDGMPADVTYPFALR